MIIIARERGRGYRFALRDESEYPIEYARTEDEAERHALGLASPGSTLRFEYRDGTEREIDL